MSDPPATDRLVAMVERLRARAASGRPGKMPKCARCDDSGLVTMEQHFVDHELADGYRKVTQAFRCECVAGASFKRFQLAPPAGPRALPLPRKDLDG